MTWSSRVRVARLIKAPPGSSGAVLGRLPAFRALSHPRRAFELVTTIPANLGQLATMKFSREGIGRDPFPFRVLRERDPGLAVIAGFSRHQYSPFNINIYFLDHV